MRSTVSAVYVWLLAADQDTKLVQRRLNQNPHKATILQSKRMGFADAAMRLHLNESASRTQQLQDATQNRFRQTNIVGDNSIDRAGFDNCTREIMRRNVEGAEVSARFGENVSGTSIEVEQLHCRAARRQMFRHHGDKVLLDTRRIHQLLLAATLLN